jgi:hypothetical protein
MFDIRDHGGQFGGGNKYTSGQLVPFSDFYPSSPSIFHTTVRDSSSHNLAKYRSPKGNYFYTTFYGASYSIKKLDKNMQHMGQIDINIGAVIGYATFGSYLYIIGEQGIARVIEDTMSQLQMWREVVHQSSDKSRPCIVYDELYMCKGKVITVYSAIDMTERRKYDFTKNFNLDGGLLEVDTQGNMYVFDNSNRIAKINRDGTIAWHRQAEPASTHAGPNYFRLDKKLGILFIATWNQDGKTITEINTNTGTNITSYKAKLDGAYVQVSAVTDSHVFLNSTQGICAVDRKTKGTVWIGDFNYILPNDGRTFGDDRCIIASHEINNAYVVKFIATMYEMK